MSSFYKKKFEFQWNVIQILLVSGGRGENVIVKIYTPSFILFYSINKIYKLVFNFFLKHLLIISFKNMLALHHSVHCRTMFKTNILIFRRNNAV